MPSPDAVKRRLDKAEEAHAARTGKHGYSVISHIGDAPEPGAKWIIVTGVPRPDPNAPVPRDARPQPPIDVWAGTPYACQDIARDPDEKAVPETAPAAHAGAPAPPMKQQLDGITEALRERARRDEIRPFDINFIPSAIDARR